MYFPWWATLLSFFAFSLPRVRSCSGVFVRVSSCSDDEPSAGGYALHYKKSYQPHFVKRETTTRHPLKYSTKFQHVRPVRATVHVTKSLRSHSCPYDMHPWDLFPTPPPQMATIFKVVQSELQFHTIAIRRLCIIPTVMCVVQTKIKEWFYWWLIINFRFVWSN
jgi:hypothetical protein